MGKQLRLWLGILGLVATSYLIFDPAHRLELAWDRFLRFAPHLLAALAVVNLARAITRSISIYLGPLLLALAAATLLLRPTVDTSRVTNLVIAVTLVGAAALVVSASSGDRSWTSVMWTGRTRTPSRLTGEVHAVAVLGEVRVDLLNCQVGEEATIVAITLGGRVVVEVPQEWRVLARPPARSLLMVREHGRRDAITPGAPNLVVRLLGLGGTLVLKRN